MPRLDVRHLLMLEAIAACTSLADAARRLSITPSALSHRMREAERRIGTPLFARTARKPQLTDAGVRLLNVAIGVLRTLDEAEKEVAAGPATRVDVVRLAASTLSSYEWLPGLMRTLQNEAPSIDVEVVLDVAVDPISALRDGIIDLAVIPSQVSTTTLASISLFDDEMIVLLPTGHPKAARHWLDAQDLIDEVYVTDGTARETGREYERLFGPAGVQPRRMLRAGPVENIIALVKAGFGVTISTRACAQQHLRGEELTAIPLTQHGLFVTWHALMRRGDFRHSPARTVADQLAGRPATHNSPDRTAVLNP